MSHYVPKPMPGHDMAFVTLGTFMLWFGWFGFNNGSVYMYVSGNTMPGMDANMANIASAEVVQRTSMNTALGGASGGLTALLVAAMFSGELTGAGGLPACISSHGSLTALLS
jgi:Amt family ammonium transporter